MYLKEITLMKEEMFEKMVQAEFVKDLLNGNEYEKEIKEQIKFHSDTYFFNIRGSQELVSELLKFESELTKTDVIVPLKDTEFKNFEREEGGKSEKTKEFILELPIGKKREEFKSHYSIKSEYPELLEIKSLYDACAKSSPDYDQETMVKLESSYMDTYSRNKSILGLLAEKIKKYRLIEIEDKKYVRAIVSPKYCNYTNRISVYFGLYVIDKLALQNKEIFKIEKAILTDSSIKVLFSGIKSRYIDGVGEVSLGIELYNNELGKGSFSLGVNYCIEINGKTIYLNPNKDLEEVSNKILNIPHNSSIGNAIRKVEKGVEDIQKYDEELMTLVKKIKENSLTEHFLATLFQGMLSSNLQKISEKTKEEIKNLKKSVSLALSIADVFGKLSEIEMEFGEKEYVQYICYKTLNEWNNK